MKANIIDFKPITIGQTTDGGTKFAMEFARFLANGGVSVKRHPFESLLTDFAGVFDPEYTVVSASGPYAWLYHYWREKLGLDFRIIRDIHGSAWTPYLMQEWLCSPLTRPGDLVLYPSEFNRSLFARQFPYIDEVARTFAGQPIFEKASFPAWKKKEIKKKNIKIGSLSRLSKDKNVLDIVHSVLELQRELNTYNFELHLLGGALDITIEVIRTAWTQAGGNPDNLNYWGHNLPQSEVDRFYQSIDILAFFSTSNVEALGRVVLEARFWNVPVCMAVHAAAKELCPPGNSVDVDYFQEQYSCDGCVNMGRIRPEEGAAALRRTLFQPELTPIRENRFRVNGFVSSLREVFENPKQASPAIDPFLHNLWHMDTPKTPSVNEAVKLVEYLLVHLRSWTLNYNPELSKNLLDQSSDPERTQAFIDNLVTGKVNYGSTSSFPFHLSQLANFHPSLTPLVIKENSPANL